MTVQNFGQLLDTSRELDHYTTIGQMEQFIAGWLFDENTIMLRACATLKFADASPCKKRVIAID